MTGTGLPPYRTLRPGQRSQIWLGGPDRSEPQLLLETTEILVEAPNWTPDGESLLLNGHGTLWRVDLGAATPSLLPVHHDGLPAINNDHVLSADGRHLYMSAMDGHIYRGRPDGGETLRVTQDEGVWHFLHGVSPDGRRLVYVRLSELGQAGRLGVMSPHGATTIVDTGPGHVDGPEWSSDARWIYFNREGFDSVAGHAQLARIPDGGGPVERLTRSDTVDWFPHLSPSGDHATYVAFPSGTTGHPADLTVEVRVVRTSDWSTAAQTYRVFGGQGTLNVNSWSPDGKTFAFVAYPIVDL